MMKATITAHSGCEGTADGSMEAVLRGIELGADIVEVDVRRAAGRGLVLAHDAVEDAAAVVPLEAAFREIAKHPGVGVNCDLKEYGLAPDVMALAEACGLEKDQLAFSGSLTPWQVMGETSVGRRARVYLNIEEALCALYRAENPGSVPDDARPWDVVLGHMAERLDAWIEPLIALCREADIRALNLPPKPFVAPYLKRLGEAGVRVSAWTVNEPDAMRELLRMPWLENLTTRRVALALDVRAALENDVHERGSDPWA